jgi:hypothetical protein
MNISVCLDQYASNYNLNALSSNGFNIYTNLDLVNPIVQGIPYTSLFSPPLGTCPYLLNNVPAGVTQLYVADNCVSNPLDPTSTIPTFQELVIDCCYAIIDVPPTPPTTASFCTTCSLNFDVFSSSYVGQIIAGNLTSACGPITSYKIGWYKDGDYSAPVFTSGKGTAFLPYLQTHPLTGSSAVPVLAGSWEGIIHDIIINGVTYSSVSGSANGQPIPFESCFDTIVVDPLTCINGTVSPLISKYSHQINYNSQAAGTTPSPVSLTYNLSPNTKYFAYVFRGFSIWDEIEIKFKSGNPAATSDPSLYVNPIYLEKLKVGYDVPMTPSSFNQATTPQLPGNWNIPTNPAANFNGILNNVWPKSFNSPSFFQRTLTLTTLETSSNPAYPDQLEITITPNPTNNNTQWKAGFQCLEDFTCTDCTFENWPNNIPKIWKVRLEKVYGCDKQRVGIFLTASCNTFNNTSDFMGYNHYGNLDPFTNPKSNLVGSLMGLVPTMLYSPTSGYVTLTPAGGCSLQPINPPSCGPSSTGTITLNKTYHQIQLTFNLESDYLYYKNNLIQAHTYNTPVLTGPISCTTNPYDLDYYRWYAVTLPIQGPYANCGDNTTYNRYYFHYNDYFNVVYNESPSTNTWSITIPQTPLIDCYPAATACNTCKNTVTSWVLYYNSFMNSPTPVTYTTYTGAKTFSPFSPFKITSAFTPAPSGSACYNGPTDSHTYNWYANHTVPFISSSTGWVNLYSLQANIPCLPNATGSFPEEWVQSPYNGSYSGFTFKYATRFPNLTGSFNYSLSTNDFEIYSYVGYGATGSMNYDDNGVFPVPCNSPSASKIFSHIGGVSTIYTASQFWNGVTPVVVIDP